MSQPPDALFPDQQSCILKLPNELLIKIFDQVFIGRHEKPPPRRPIASLQGLCPDILSLRRVCSRFRKLAVSLPFWYEAAVDIVDLFPHPRGRQCYTVGSALDLNIVFRSLQDDHGAVLKVFLSDDLLQSAIGRRNYWQFKHPSTLLAALECVPDFPFNTQTVAVEIWDGFGTFKNSRSLPTFAVIAMLAICRNLTELCLIAIDDAINLSLIATACPNLKSLRLRDLFEPKGARIEGSLTKFKFLEEFDIRGFGSILCHEMFPTTFAENLSCFICVYATGSTFNIGERCLSSILKELVNLTTLWISPVTEHVCEAISKANLFNLRSLRIAVRASDSYFASMQQVKKILENGNLSLLHELVLGFESNTGSEGIVEAIGENFRCLRRLTLFMESRKSWWGSLASVEYIRRWDWYTPQSEDIIDLPREKLVEDPDGFLDIPPLDGMNHFRSPSGLTTFPVKTLSVDVFQCVFEWDSGYSLFGSFWD
jgi:hypothetical protein